MAEGYIDLSGIYRAIDSLESHVQSSIKTVNGNIGVIDKKIASLGDYVEKNLKVIFNRLLEMDRKQALDSALQRALTEIVRVRQELEQRFHNQKKVRESMIGILHATDLALIRRNTISTISEELMVATPKYWLAPALVAIAGWISNDMDLAKRALQEAFRRDDEHTALLMALLTRRVNYSRARAGMEMKDTAFGWLQYYFSKQNPFKMRHSIVTFVDCYVNGVFGADVEGICQAQIDSWMNTLRTEDPDFAEKQKNYWRTYFKGFCHAAVGDGPKALETLSGQYHQVMDYATRVDAITRKGGIQTKVDDILQADIDYQFLIQQIDIQLVRLVNGFDADENDLRKEEEYLNYVKFFKGDEDKAKALMNAIEQKTADEEVDFAKRLSVSITSESEKVSPNERKTALFLLREYVEDAFEEFVKEAKDAFPETVQLKFEEKGQGGRKFVWSGTTENGDNAEDLAREIQAKYEDEKKKALTDVSDEAANKMIKSGTIMAVTLFWLLLIPLFIGLKKRKQGKALLQANAKKRSDIAAYYDAQCANHIRDVKTAATYVGTAREVVNEFEHTVYVDGLFAHMPAPEEAEIHEEAVAEESEAELYAAEEEVPEETEVLEEETVEAAEASEEEIPETDVPAEEEAPEEEEVPEEEPAAEEELPEDDPAETDEDKSEGK